MPRNGNGGFQLAEPPFVTFTPISSSAMNSDLSDIATALTGSVAADGQTTITGQLKGANGSAAAPSYSFAVDLNSGLYRAAADSVGITAGGAAVLLAGTSGLTIINQLLAADGTEALPSISFASEPETGFYYIGANNVGFAVNEAKVIDIDASGVDITGSLSVNGAALTPTPQSAIMANGTIVESHAGNAVTFAVKTLAGADPSASDPVTFYFRSATAATGTYTAVQATAALSLTVSSGSTLGFTSAVPGRLWLTVFNNAGTPQLAVINCRSAGGMNVYPLSAWGLASTSAEGGVGGADSAWTFYASSAFGPVAYLVIGYASYESGITTAGSWDVAPTRLQLFGLGVPLPGASVQIVQNTTTTQGGTNSGPLTPLTTGQSQLINLTSACSLVKVSWFGSANTTGSSNITLQFYRGSTPVGAQQYRNTAVAEAYSVGQTALDFPAAASATYAIWGSTSGGIFVAYPISGLTAVLLLEEIMV